MRALSRFFPVRSATAEAKVFWFFFSKKNCLPSMCQPQSGLVSHISKVGAGQMYAVLVRAHVSLTMVAFGASPLGRLGLRSLLSGVSEPRSAKVILRGFSGIFRAGGLSITAGVCVGLALAWSGGLAQTWIMASIVLITIAGVGGFAIEDRWVKILRRAEGDAFTAILHERIPHLAAFASPVLWLCILWLMIEKPA